MPTTLHELLAAGQSVWLDYIRRDLLRTGRLAALVDDGIRGLTSNPTIFEKAIAESDIYDDDIARLADAPPAEVFEALAIADIRAAADVFAEVHTATNGRDGFVSLEVAPALAHDARGTIAEARRLWAAVDRPNLMIKVPATEAGIVAIEELVAAGINVNATLMFGLDHYEAVAGAFLHGAARGTGTPASVASFFVSRVDTKTDAALETVGSPEALSLRGTIAAANAKLAYQRFRELFGGAAFESLATRGVAPQRPLWASTSTKNPAYPDLLYVEPLVGRDTVNTVPPTTLDALLDHGRVEPDAVERDIDDARRRIDRLAELGIDFGEITATLQTEGVAAFAASFDQLLEVIAKKQALLRA